MKTIFRISVACIRQHWAFYLGIAVALESAAAVLDSKARLGGELVIMVSFIYFLHRNMLLGEGPEAAFGTAKTGKPSGRRGFVWVTVLFFVALITTTVAAFTFLSPVPFRHPAGIVVLLLIFVTANWIGLSLFGSAFPASAIGDKFGLGLTLKRARATGLGTALGLFLGPGLFGLLGMILFAIVPARFGISAGLEFADFHNPFSVMLLVQGCLGLAARLSGMVATTLAVATLCEAYRRIQPAPVDLST